MNGGVGFGARPVKPFGRGRAWVRQTRAYGKSMIGRDGSVACRGCAAERSGLPWAAGDWLERKGMAETVIEEAGGKDLFAGKVQKCGAGRSTWGFVVGESLFMVQRRPSEESEVGFRQR